MAKERIVVTNTEEFWATHGNCLYLLNLSKKKMDPRFRIYM